MGNEKSKEANNEELKKIGEKANDNENKQTFDLNIQLTNDIIIDELKTNPEKYYKMEKHLGDGIYSSVYIVSNKLTGENRVMKIIDKSKIYTEESEKKNSK